MLVEGTRTVGNIAAAEAAAISNFWRTLKMLVINCEINLDINWSKECVIVASYRFSKSRCNILNN